VPFLIGKAAANWFKKDELHLCGKYKINIYYSPACRCKAPTPIGKKKPFVSQKSDSC